MKKEYLTHLKFDVWSANTWFIGEDSPEAEERWQQARRTLPQVAESCGNPLEFAGRAAEHFKSYGFDRVHR